MREKEANGEVTCGKEETSHLNCWTKSGGERNKEGKRKRKEKKRKNNRRGVRSSIFSLDFMEIGLSVFVEARDKFLIHDESFTWV